MDNTLIVTDVDVPGRERIPLGPYSLVFNLRGEPVLGTVNEISSEDETGVPIPQGLPPWYIEIPGDRSQYRLCPGGLRRVIFLGYAGSAVKAGRFDGGEHSRNPHDLGFRYARDSAHLIDGILLDPVS